jgi:hypothetical protein
VTELRVRVRARASARKPERGAGDAGVTESARDARESSPRSAAGLTGHLALCVTRAHGRAGRSVTMPCETRRHFGVVRARNFFGLARDGTRVASADSKQFAPSSSARRRWFFATRGANARLDPHFSWTPGFRSANRAPHGADRASDPARVPDVAETQNGGVDGHDIHRHVLH